MNYLSRWHRKAEGADRGRACTAVDADGKGE